MCFLENIYILILYINYFIWKKKLYFFFTEKRFFLQKMKKYISNLRNIFLSRKYIFILLKLRGELNNLVLKVSEAPNMWYSLN